MKELDIVFYDEDVVYMKALIRAFQRARVLDVNYIILTDQMKLMSYIKDQSAVLFLVTQEIYETVILDYIKGFEANEKESIREKIMILSETTEAAYPEVTTIFKYQAVGAIIEPVKQWFLIHHKEEANKRLHAKIIAVLELASNDSSSLLGHAIAKIQSEYENVALVNLELFPFLFGRQQTTYSLSDYIYAITTNSGCSGDIAKQMKYQNGSLHCVTPIQCFEDLYELDGKFAGDFLEKLNEDTEYDAIVLVMDFLQPFTLKFLSNCDQIISLELTDYVAKQKREQFYSMLELTECEWLKERIEYYPLTSQYLLANIMEDGTLTDELKAVLSPMINEMG